MKNEAKNLGLIKLAVDFACVGTVSSINLSFSLITICAQSQASSPAYSSFCMLEQLFVQTLAFLAKSNTKVLLFISALAQYR